MKHPPRPLVASVVALALALVAGLARPAASAAQDILVDAEGREYLPDRLVIKLRPDAAAKASSAPSPGAPAQASYDALVARWGGAPEPLYPDAGAPVQGKAATARAQSASPAEALTVLLELPPGSDVETALAEFAAAPDVEFAEPDFVYRLDFTPDDPQYAQQTYLGTVSLPAAWDVDQGSTQPVIAIIDTGVDLDHPDLASKIWSNSDEVPGDGNGDGRPGFAGFDDDGDGLIDEDSAGRQPGDPGYSNDLKNDDDENGYVDDVRGWNFLFSNASPQDDHGHGTHCAGAAAAATNNATGVAGACPLCRIMPLKAFSASGAAGASSDIARAISYAARNGAAVISMSFGGPAATVVENALAAAYSSSILVAAAGNDGVTSPANLNYPAAYASVVGVGATDGDARAAFSNVSSADVFAPGQAIRSTMLNDTYASWSGTSMATPIVAGVAGLLVSRFNGGFWGTDLYVGQLLNGSDVLPGDVVTEHLDKTVRRIDAQQVVTIVPVPSLVLDQTTVVDTAGDNDGVADAGETFNLRFTVRNTWGNATGVTATLTSASPFVTINDGSSAFGNIGPNASAQNNVDPMTVTLSASTPNAAEIPLHLVVTAPGAAQIVDQDVILTAQRGATVSGAITSNTTWLADQIYLLTDDVVIASGVTLTIQPGAIVQLGAGKNINVDGTIIADGNGGNPIVFTGNGPSVRWGGIRFSATAPDTSLTGGGAYVSGPRFRNVIFEHGGTYPYSVVGLSGPPANRRVLLEDCEFRDNQVELGLVNLGRDTILRRCRVHDNSSNIYPLLLGESNYARGPKLESTTVTHNGPSQINVTGSQNISNSLIAFNDSREDNFYTGSGTAVWIRQQTGETPAITSNCIFANKQVAGSNVGAELNMGTQGTSGFVINVENNYWGTSSVAAMEATFRDFEDGLSAPNLDGDPLLATPPATCPAHLWRVTRTPAGVVGAGLATFTLDFNRPMDTSVRPAVTFGPASPYTSKLVSGAWSSATTWIGTYTVSLFTGDGIQTLRVAGARGTDGMEIPEDTRHQFTISTTGLSGVNLQASGEAGRVDLFFNPVDEPDLAGYNVYRSDTTGGPYVKINPAVVVDATYSDFTAPEGVVKYYTVRAVRTDFTESSASAEASAAALDGSGPGLTHTPITQVPIGAPGVTVQANASDPSGMGLVRLFYKRTGEPSWVTVNMPNPSGTLYATNIPGAYVTLAGIDYYIEANDQIGNQTFFASAASPQHIVVYECLDDAQCADDGNPCTGEVCSSGQCTHPAGHAGATCRAAAGTCDVAETCTGASPACPADGFLPATSVCRGAAGECDAAETCSGASAACPADVLQPSGAPCTDDGNVCTVDTCNGSSTTCQHPVGNPGAVCRGPAGGCDAAELCTGASAVCPPDLLAGAGTVCRAAAGPCDVAETCSGVSAACPADQLQASGVQCRAAAGTCDVAESCNGTSAACPADQLVPSTVVCRPSTGPCDVAEQCTGVTGACPADSGSPDADADGTCDAIDACTNVGGGQTFKASPKPRLLLSKIALDAIPGNDKLTLQGVFSLAPGSSFGDLAPLASGVRVLLTNAADGSEIDVTLPGGLYTGNGSRGWRPNGTGTRWQYLDKTTDGSSATLYAGITQVLLVDRSKKSPREVMVKISGKNGTYPVLPADLPLQATVVLGDASAGSAGRCGESDFQSGQCVFNGTQTSVKCQP